MKLEGFKIRVLTYIERLHLEGTRDGQELPLLSEPAPDQEWLGLWRAKMEMQGLRPTDQLQAAARRAAVEERNRGPVVHAGPVNERHRQATRRLDTLNPELDPGPCRDARAAPSPATRRGRGRDGTG